MKILQATLMALLVSSLFVIKAQEPTPKPGSPHQHNLMPVPASVQFQSGRLGVNREFSVAVQGQSDARLQSAIGRMLRRLEGRTGYEFVRALRADQSRATLVVQCNGAGLDLPSFKEDESYDLEITDQQARLVAPTVVGAIRGLETLLQLLEGDRDGYYFPNVKIQDQPRFPWRGLLIDVARHYQPMEVLKRNLDAMAAVKLNVLHWHLTEDQGFRIESRKYPKLHQMGSDGLYYTQDQAREIIAYARDRGIRVLPEFDMPGHATSWLVGYPLLGSAPGPYEIERRPGIFEPALDPTREEVYKFLDGFLGEMAALFPDAYVHIGGDENEGKQWERNPRIQAFMKQKGIKDNHALQTHFNQRVLKILRKHGKKMMGWDEIFQPDLPNEVVIHSWRGPSSLAEAARKGFNSVLSAGYYIDLSFPTSNHYAIDPLPAGSALTSAEAAHVLGGEATMWSEWVTPETIDSRIWPRTAAIAERLWSPRSIVDVDDMYRRLAIVSIQLEELGLTHEKNVRMLLRRLTQGSEIGPLQTLVSVVEPVKEYRRYQMRPQTMLSPLTGLIDAARPDSAAARNFEVMVEGFLSDAPRFLLRRENTREMLARWRDAGLDLEAVIDRSPALHEARPLAKDLREIGGAGLEAMSYLTAGIAPTAEWRDAKLALLDVAAKPKAALEFAIIPSVRELVIAASELARLQQTTPMEWRKSVKALASLARPTGK
ncbi:MAG TPA: family 20 glycosylhydrolase [Pyrinomonadaceae bacterium]|nr:family 20 glycosylhydrolase [Pyrinomonadaceae bacterium]